ncbi:MAG TPA: dihydrodipicolinate synthase family protein, partial [Opitutaceae bacterium]|nr:dihydrodipicolinate synthase family protein [Opitutaceae bacterium]
SRIAEATNRTIILYSIPGRCGIEIGVPVIERLRAKYPHVSHIKEAGGTVDRVDQIKQALGKDIVVLSGDDSLTLPFMSVGAEGVISVASNLYVKEVKKLVTLALQNDYAKAAILHRKLYPVFKALFVEPNPVPIKVAMADAGIISSAEVRAPLCDMLEANLNFMRATVAALKK